MAKIEEVANLTYEPSENDIIFEEATGAGFMAEFQSYIDSDSGEDFTISIRCPDGKIVPFWYMASIAHAKRGIDRYFVIMGPKDDEEVEFVTLMARKPNGNIIFVVENDESVCNGVRDELEEIRSGGGFNKEEALYVDEVYGGLFLGKLAYKFSNMMRDYILKKDSGAASGAPAAENAAADGSGDKGDKE